MSRLLKQQTGGIVETFIILVTCGSVHGTFQDCLPLMNVTIRRNPSRGRGRWSVWSQCITVKKKKKKSDAENVASPAASPGAPFTQMCLCFLRAVR